VNHPAFRSCLDVGHASLFSDSSLDVWLAALTPYLVHCHLNNNLGQVDEHRSFNDGVLDYKLVLSMLRGLPRIPSFSLEMAEVSSMRDSLSYLRLPQPVSSVTTRR
jgi:sugar phosphate isomerase/epimerase